MIQVCTCAIVQIYRMAWIKAYMHIRTFNAMQDAEPEPARL